MQSDLLMILQWRTNPDITKFMNTDIEFDIDKQYQWYEEKVSIHSPALHWVIVHNDRPVGFLNLENYDKENHTTSWSYYIGELESRIIGSLIPAYFYNYMFFKRDIELDKIYGQLFKDNLKVLKMHQLYGVKEVELLKDHIYKHGKSFDIISIEMSRKNWLSQKEKFQNYHSIFEE